MESAQIACNEIYENPEVIQVSGGHRCNIDKFWLDNLECNGDEEDFNLCPHNPWGQHNCNPATECILLQCAG